MNYDKFRLEVQNSPFILTKDIIKKYPDHQNLRNQINRWNKKGLLSRLRKGMYVLNKGDIKVDIDKCLIANYIYEPSYISMEYALNFYGLIPERVVDITSITTRKTKTFVNDLGSFTYQHIKTNAFRGFISVENGAFSFFIAEPEKAIVDFLYLNLSKFSEEECKEIIESYRFQNLDELDCEKLMKFGGLFSNKKLMHIIAKFCELIEE